MLSLGATVCFLAMYCYLRLGSTRQIDSLYELKEGLNAGTSLNGAEFELDSDEYEFEDDSDAEAPQEGGQARPLRRLFHLRNGHRRSGSKDTTPTRRSGSIVRITSSDPRSSLSSSPFQCDLESKLSISDTVTQDAATNSIVQQTGSMARRRRESGRLLNGISSGSSPSRGTSSVARNTTSRTGSPLTHSASPLRPARSNRRPVDKGGQESLQSNSSPEPPSGEEEWHQSSSASIHSFASAGSEYDEEEVFTPPRSTGPPSILKRNPESYASIPRIEPSAMYSLNGNGDRWGDSSWQGHPSETSRDSFENDFSFMIPPPPSNVSRLPPGAGHGPSSALYRGGPSSPRLGLLTPAQARAIWPEPRSKSIRLKEPDWTPYVDVHDRARERLETAAHVAANPRAASPIPPSQPFSSFITFDNLEEDRKELTDRELALQEEEFWFERYSRSTAAAGRDWDWRKRRKARQMAAAAAAAEAALAAGEIPDMLPENLMNDSTTNLSEGATEAGPNINTNTNNNEDHVGMTDVQLQRQRFEHARRTNRHPHSQQPFAPNAQNTTGRPTLSVTTSDSYLLRNGAGQANSSSNMTGKITSSPLNKALRLKRYSTPDSPSLEEGAKNRVNGFLKSESSTDVSLSSSLVQNGSVGRRKKERGSLPGLRMRRSSESYYREAKEAVSVPNRFSSLTPKMVKRSLSAKRERDAAITAQLLAEAEEVATDEDEQERAQKEHLQLMVKTATPHASMGIRKSASSSLLNNQYNNYSNNNDLDNSITAPRSSADIWRGSEAGWSSADAYGLSQPSTPAPSLPHHPPKPASNSLLVFGGMAQDLSRQGSNTESQSSGSSTSKQAFPQDPPIYSSRPRSGSRKGILSSANKVSLDGETDSSRRKPYSDDMPVNNRINSQ